jgi:hypothetical protein
MKWILVIWIVGGITHYVPEQTSFIKQDECLKEARKVVDSSDGNGSAFCTLGYVTKE